mgnify:CR=1 FL=1
MVYAEVLVDVIAIFVAIWFSNKVNEMMSSDELDVEAVEIVDVDELETNSEPWDMPVDLDSLGIHELRSACQRHHINWWNNVSGKRKYLSRSEMIKALEPLRLTRIQVLFS